MEESVKYPTYVRDSVSESHVFVFIDMRSVSSLRGPSVSGFIKILKT